MPEYATFDENKYSYDDITEEDIWEHHVEMEIGVIKLT